MKNLHFCAWNIKEKQNAIENQIIKYSKHTKINKNELIKTDNYSINLD